MKLLGLVCWLAFLSGFNSLACALDIEDNSDWGREQDNQDLGAVADDGANAAGNNESIVDKIHQIDSPDFSKYGIRRGCIAQNRIKNIRFKDDQSAVVEIGRGKRLLLRLHRECSGIKREGFEYQSRQGQLCAKFSRFRVIGRSLDCTVDSITPYIDIEDIKPEET